MSPVNTNTPAKQATDFLARAFVFLRGGVPRVAVYQIASGRGQVVPSYLLPVPER